MQSLWMLLASLFFALMAACTKWGAADYGTFTLVFYRSAIGCIAIAAWIIATRREIRTHYLWGHFKRCFIGIGNLALWFWTLSKLPLETGMTLNYTSPLFMALFVVAVSYKKKLPVAWSLIAAIAVGFVGILMVLRPTVSAGQEHIALIGLACGILSTWAYLQVRDLNKLHEPVWRIVFYFTFFGSLFGLLGSLSRAAFQLCPLSVVSRRSPVPGSSGYLRSSALRGRSALVIFSLPLCFSSRRLLSLP